MKTALTHIQRLIDGPWTERATGRRIDAVNPATGAHIGTVARAD